jgi:hypothetical protein
MDPIYLATLTTAVTTLGIECAKGIAGEAGKSLWAEIKSIFTWKEEPATSDLAIKIAQKLQDNPEIARQIEAVLKRDLAQSTTSGSLIAHVSGGKVMAAETMFIGTVNM